MPRPINTWDVLAQSQCRHTGKPIAVARTERVDTSNSLFASCRTIMDVKEAYEAFWNLLNPNSPQVVFVHGITPVARPR